MNKTTETSPFPVAILHDVGYGQAIAQLPSSVRWVTLLAVDQGMSTEEIADLAGVRVDVVVEVLERGLLLAQDIRQRLISATTGGVYGNH